MERHASSSSSSSSSYDGESRAYVSLVISPMHETHNIFRTSLYIEFHPVSTSYGYIKFHPSWNKSFHGNTIGSQSSLLQNEMIGRSTDLVRFHWSLNHRDKKPPSSDLDWMDTHKKKKKKKKKSFHIFHFARSKALSCFRVLLDSDDRRSDEATQVVGKTFTTDLHTETELIKTLRAWKRQF
jgi:hypothetical protein